jgi:hypothetical protein
MLVLAVACAGLVCTPDGALAQKSDYTHTASLSPQAPAVGTYYALYVTFTNHSNRTILFEVSVDSVPLGDQLVSAKSQQQYVAAGQSHTFRFDIYCGVDGGTVNWSHRAKFAN